MILIVLLNLFLLGFWVVFFIFILLGGAFSGSKELKSLLQLMAASEGFYYYFILGNRKGLIFHTFGDSEFAKELLQMFNLLVYLNITIGEVYLLLLSSSENKSIFSHIRDNLLFN
jgi:hypothetical protein